ncbi:unnamed protein product [Pelagomonas calceolata]|uniref:Enhancer of mRNA-decapping protein 4 C-terminal domain-containing protein n=3 Tax=Pelagomonas calceolata TaxID=35677 RepID=A0A8J2SZC1_9STRA|nr:unnamed protein product [Pelagomonas calceolata]
MDAYAAPAGDAFRAPKCTPVTLYQSEEKPPAESASSQLAACEGFLAYAIKGGKIRVLARGSATRTLLRGHSQRIVDLAFGGGAAGAAASLASCCAGGRLCTWTVREGPGGDEVAHERGPELEIAGAVRLAWRPGPAPPPALAVAGEAGAVVVADARDAASLKQLPRGGSSCHDVGWSADGAALATAAADGRVRVFDDRLELVADFAPAGGAPVHAVAFLAGDRLATAVDGGETISLWTVAPGDAPRRDHALALARPPANTRPARARRVAAAGGGAFVLVTAAAPATDAAADESAGAALYVAHVDAETNKIDHVAPFAVSQPVLSLAALDADLTDDANDAEADAEPAGFEIQLFCVQTRAIQQLQKFAALHLSPEPRPTPAAPAPPPAPAALAFDVAAAPTPPPAPAALAFDVAAFAAEAKAEAAAAAVSAVRTVTATVTQLVDASLARAAAAQEASTRSIATQLDRISAADADAPRARAAAMRLGAMEGSGVAIKQVLPEVLARVDALEKKIDVRVDALEKKIDVRVDALEKKIDAILAATASAPPASAATASEPPAATSSTDVRTRCRMLASSGDYDSAVYRAVEQSDVDVLLYALDAVGIDKVRTMSPLPFGQLTLLCLVQQLGTTLARDDAVDFKLEWLQLAVLGLDASNPRIADHVPAVLLQVKACMEGLPAAVTARHRERISLLVHVCQSIGSSATRRA